MEPMRPEPGVRRGVQGAVFRSDRASGAVRVVHSVTTL